MSGNTNQPPASAPESTVRTADQLVREFLDNRLTAAEISPSGELFRAWDRFNRTRTAANGQASARALNQMSAEVLNTENVLAESRGRIQRVADILGDRLRGHPPPTLVPNSQQAIMAASSRRHPTGQRSSSIGDARRHRIRMSMTDGDQYLERNRTFTENRPSAAGSTSGMDVSSIADLHQAPQRRETATSRLRALLDESFSLVQSSGLYSSENDTARPVKRRKLDGGAADLGFSGFSYGHFGQVEPGKLKMEIDFCDGGIFSEERGANFSAANILKNDDSVYCTKANRCNLVLKHQGATPFTLTELIIKAPPSGYTAPVQEGMVFISMTSDELLTRTAQYQIQYSPPRNSRRGTNSVGNVEPPHISSIRHSSNNNIVPEVARRQHHNLDSDEDDYRPAQIPAEFVIPDAPTFHVTTECGDSDDSDSTRARRRRAPIRIGSLRIEESDGSSSDDSDRPWRDDYLLVNPRDSPRAYRHERRATASRISIGLAEAVEAAQEATQEAVKAVGGSLMAPHARFFIERNKSKCVIRFEPAVSARFILLKMWSPHHTPGENIDIESVVVKGFAGPRYFPAVKPR